MRFLTLTTIGLTILFALLQGWLLVATAALLLFSAFGPTAILIPLAVLVDGYFGNFTSVPGLSIVAVGWYLLSEYLRPRMISIVQ